MSSATPWMPSIEKDYNAAQRQYVEQYGSVLVMNTYLKMALLLMSLLSLGLLVLNFRTQAKYATVKPLVVRIDEVGRAEAVQYDASAYQPQAPELRYFLTQFVVKHFSRLRATVQREYADSLFFLDPAYPGIMQDAVDQQVHALDPSDHQCQLFFPVII